MASLRINRCAYVPGESILINAEIDNCSSVRVKAVEAYLQQVNWRNLLSCLCLLNSFVYLFLEYDFLDENSKSVLSRRNENWLG